MKRLFFSSALIFGFAISSEAQTFQNNANCEIALYEQCYEIATCAPSPPPAPPQPTLVATAAPSNTVFYSSICNPATEFSVFYIEYTICPGVVSGLFSNYPTACNPMPFGASSYINRFDECPGCDYVDVVDQPAGGGVKVGN